MCTCSSDNCLLLPLTVTFVLRGEIDRVTGGKIWNSPGRNRIWDDVKVDIPGTVTVILYTSGGNPANANCPLMPDFNMREKPESPSSVTLAPWITPWFVSRTVPVMRPVPVCCESFFS